MNQALEDLKKKLCSKVNNETLKQKIMSKNITNLLSVPKSATTQIPDEIEQLSDIKWLEHPTNNCLEYCVLDNNVSIVKLNNELIGWVPNNNLDDMDDDLDEYKSAIEKYINN